MELARFSVWISLLIQLIAACNCISLFPDLDQIASGVRRVLEPRLKGIANRKCREDVRKFIDGTQSRQQWALESEYLNRNNLKILFSLASKISQKHKFKHQ
jgi:hypothetical protein